ncbi:MAG: GNAT family N-acetyltransferase [Planctomycetaceae bacterium]|nr:GNAT family N-acetyltransferase [Planctomycetaceae bacterium]
MLIEQMVDTTPVYPVRPANLDDPVDEAAIVELLDLYARTAQPDGDPLTPEVCEQLVPGLRVIDGAFVMLAHYESLAVGLAVCLPGYSTFAAQRLINVHDLVVRTEYQGQGIGSQLLRAVEAHARTLGCCKITLEVREENQGAERLYRRLAYSDPSGQRTRFLERLL